MTLTLEQTDRIVMVNGVRARVWEGTTGRGVKVFALVTRIGIHDSDNSSELEAELMEMRPSALRGIEAFPFKLVL